MSELTADVGQVIGQESFTLTRSDLVRYAGASGDFNPIHWSPSHALSVGLPDVIAHGMLTMATAGRIVTDWCGDPGRVIDYQARFSAMVVVPDTADGAQLDVEAVVTDITDGIALVEITARCNGTKVLTQTRARVRLA